MKKVILCIAAMALLAFAACNQEEVTEQAPSPTPEMAEQSSKAAVLTAEEIKFFNEEFFATEVAFPGDWIRNTILSHEFSEPAQVNIEAMFYNEKGVGQELTAEEKEFLKSQGAPEGDIKKFTRGYMDDLLNYYIGMPLEATAKIGLDKFYYNEAQDAYYLVHSDAMDVFVKVEEGWCSESGALSLFYRHSNEPMENLTEEQIAELPRYMVVLLATDTGYQFLANQKLAE